jgi:hypothetical protein
VKFLLPDCDSVEQAEIPAAMAAITALLGQLAVRLITTPPVVAEPAARGNDDDLLDTTQAAALLKCSSKWLYRHAQQLSAVRRGREYLWSRRAINRWLARQRA